MVEVSPRFRIWIAGLGVGLLTVLLIPTAGVLWMNSDWVPNSTVSRLAGASRADVRQLLGEQDHIDANGDKWAFTRTGRFAEFQVHFAADGTVESCYYDR